MENFIKNNSGEIFLEDSSSRSEVERDSDNTGISVVSAKTRATIGSKRSPEREISYDIKRRKTECNEVEDSYGIKEAFMVALSTEKMGLTPSEASVWDHIGAQILDHLLHPKDLLATLIENPLFMLDMHSFYIMQLMRSMEHESFAEQTTRLKSLIDSIETKQKTIPTYREPYKYDFPHDYGESIDKKHLANTKADQLIWLINTQIDAIEEEQKLMAEMEQHERFFDFDRCNLWKLAIDHKDHKKGKYAYENEAGYLKGYFAGLRYVLEQVRLQTFTADWDTLFKINQTMTFKVEDRHHIPIQARVKEDGKVGYCSIFPTVAYMKQFEEAFTLFSNKAEVHESMRLEAMPDGPDVVHLDRVEIKRCEHYQIKIFPHKIEIMRNDSCNTIQKEIDSAHRLFEQFEDKLKMAQTQEDIELAIIFYVTQLERMHLFVDGNLRSVMVLWTGIRLTNNLDLTIMDNPNDLDAYSDKEILQIVKNGTVNFKSLLKENAVGYQAWNDKLMIQSEIYKQPALETETDNNCVIQ